MAASVFSSLSKAISFLLPSFSPPPSSSSLPSPPPSALADEIAKLDRTVRRIGAVLADADEREIVDEAVKLWVSELKQAAYKAEEVLEDYSYELLRRASPHKGLGFWVDDVIGLYEPLHEVLVKLSFIDSEEKTWMLELKQRADDAKRLLESCYGLLRCAAVQKEEKAAAHQIAQIKKLRSLLSVVREKSKFYYGLSGLSILPMAVNTLERYSYEAVHEAKVTTDSSVLPLWDCDASFQEGILHRISKIREYLDEISRDRVDLALTEQDGPRRREIRCIARPTSSLLDPLEVYGREDEKKQIIDALLGDVECALSKKRSREWEHQDEIFFSMLIAVVAMGGMGKTTLARLVYNDPIVRSHFEVQAWVWVSEAFDEVRLTKAVIESITGNSCNLTELEPLQRRLEDEVRGKKILVVLDDVWNEDPFRWETMRRPLFAAAKGSRMIITTRNENVASVMRTDQIVHLGGLSETPSWALFSRLAFPEEASRERDLGLIGKKIVEKSNGVPLVLRTLGAMLSSDTSLEFWNDVLRSNLWELDRGREYILPILKLSYYYLPSALKQCFTFLAAFPKGGELDIEELVRMWCALGFIHDNGAKQMEEIGRFYVNELVRKSFLQRPAYSQEMVTMHDLIHDLANSIGGEESTATDHFSLSNGSCSSNLRHLTVFSELYHFERLESALPFSLPAVQHYSLRTLSFQSCESFRSFHLEARALQSPEVPYLRILDASSCRRVKLDESVGALHHLRYLSMCQRKMPGAICKLFKLRTLVNTYTGRMLLPRNIVTLTSLRHLILGRGLRPYAVFPAGIGRLTNLQSLSRFTVGRRGSEDATLSELEYMNSIRGELSIVGLENIAYGGIEEARGANLQRKQLTRLRFVWTTSPWLQEESQDEAVLEHLRPHSCLQYLTIFGYKGSHFPAWLGDNCFSKMLELELIHAPMCVPLPPLGQLPSLKQLKLISLTKLRTVGPEFYGNLDVSFPSLEGLVFHDLYALEEWSWPAGEVRSIFPCLRTLGINGCRKLTDLPVLNLHALQSISISFCRKLRRIVGLEECIIGRSSDCRAGHRQVLRLLRTVKVAFCPSLEESLVSLLCHQKEISFTCDTRSGRVRP